MPQWNEAFSPMQSSETSPFHPWHPDPLHRAFSYRRPQKTSSTTPPLGGANPSTPKAHVSSCRRTWKCHLSARPPPHSHLWVCNPDRIGFRPPRSSHDSPTKCHQKWSSLATWRSIVSEPTAQLPCYPFLRRIEASGNLSQNHPQTQSWKPSTLLGTPEVPLLCWPTKENQLACIRPPAPDRVHPPKTMRPSSHLASVRNNSPL